MGAGFIRPAYGLKLEPANVSGGAPDVKTGSADIPAGILKPEEAGEGSFLIKGFQPNL
jgi:hypothetical protein